MNLARLRGLLCLLPLLCGTLAHGVALRGPVRGSNPGGAAVIVPLNKAGTLNFAALTADPQAGLKSLLALSKESPKVERHPVAQPPQASFLLGLLTDPELIKENREFFTAAVGAENVQALESAAKAIAEESGADETLARLVTGIREGTHVAHGLRVRQAADLLGAWFDGSRRPDADGPVEGRSLVKAVSNLEPAGTPKAAPLKKPGRVPSLLGRPRIDKSLADVSRERFSNPFYHNKAGELRSIEYGSPVSRTLGIRDVHALSYPYRRDGELVIDLLVESLGKGPRTVETVPLETLKKTDLPRFKKYWLQPGFSGTPPLKVPSRRANRYLLGRPKLVQGKRVLVEVSGRDYWFDLEKLYLANLYQPDNSLVTLRQLTEAGGEGYILRADYFQKHSDRENPAYYFGELVVVTKAPDPGRKPAPLMKGAEPKTSLFDKPGFKAGLEDLAKMGVQVAFGDFEGVAGVYLPQSNRATKLLKTRFEEFRKGKLGMIFLSAKDTLDTLHHEKSHALDRIHIMPRFAKAMQPLEKLHGDFTRAQVSKIWTYLTEQRAYTESYFQLKKEGRMKPKTDWDFGPTVQGAKEKMLRYRADLIEVLAELSPGMRKAVRAVLEDLARPELKRLPAFRVPNR